MASPRWSDRPGAGCGGGEVEAELLTLPVWLIDDEHHELAPPPIRDLIDPDASRPGEGISPLAVLGHGPIDESIAPRVTQTIRNARPQPTSMCAPPARHAAMSSHALVCPRTTPGP